MSAITAFRLSGGFWLIPLLFAMGVFGALSNRPAERGYIVYEFASAAQAVILVGPILAGFSVLSASRMNAFIDVKARARSRIYARLVALWPLLLAGPVTGVVAMIVALRSLPLDRASAEICLIYFATTTACAALGSLASRVAPVSMAVPFVSIGTFAWLALPAGGPNILLRNMNSSFVGCCTSEQEPATAMIVGSLAVALSVTFFSVWGASVLTKRSAALGGICATLICAFSIGAVTANVATDELRLMAVEQRTSDLECAGAQDVRLCVWPEHQQQLAWSVDVVQDVHKRLQAAGIALPTQFSEAPNPEAVSVSVPRVATPGSVRVTIVQGLLPYPSDCRANGVDFNEILGWLAVQAGVAPGQLKQVVPAQSVDAVASRVAAPLEDQLSWYLEQRTTLESACGAR